MTGRLLRAVLALAALALLLGAAVVVLNLRGEAAIPAGAGAAGFEPTPAQIERGRYLARAGNCASCHTARGGVEYAGGRALPTPFGTVFGSNLTPDAATGIGDWSPAHFWRALHHGRSRDGRLLYPAFPYTSYTRVTREDADALYAYLHSLPPVHQPNRPHELRFPYGTQAALAVWRALYFRPGVFEPDPARPDDWNRGAYLVRGLGHCSACHAERNALGAERDGLALAGGLMPVQNWYAPSLAAPEEAGVADWARGEVVALLRDGVAPRGSVLGPMAEVVWGSTRHLHDADLGAIAAYLQALPRRPPAAAGPGAPRDRAGLELGARLYERHCASCHGEVGEGRPGAFPALAGNRAVTMASPANLIRVVLQGGYPPSTAGNPRPHGMPPFAHQLNDAEVAAVISHVRTAWGNGAPAISVLDVLRHR